MRYIITILLLLGCTGANAQCSPYCQVPDTFAKSMDGVRVGIFEFSYAVDTFGRYMIDTGEVRTFAPFFEVLKVQGWQLRYECLTQGDFTYFLNDDQWQK